MNARLGSWAGLLAIWLLVLLTVLLTRPLLPVDETRYAAVAWEMWQRGDFLVPYLNGEPYSHKPPLFFWLIHAGWWLFGVNEWVVRVIAPLITLALLLATATLSRKLWPEDALAVQLVPWVVFGSVFFTAFYSWVQIDLLLVLCVVLAMTGLVHAAQGARSGWLLTGVAIGLGLLAKGPVILLHVLPVALLAPLWKRDAAPNFWWSWYAGLVASVLLGAVIALAWAFPAAQAGGEAYREAILWGQTANRLVQSFAHAHPVWWYLPWLPVLFAPWILLPWLWARICRWDILQDEGLRLCLAWLLSVVFLLSLVSGKQLKYLLPVLPAFALLVARVLSLAEDRTIDRRPWLLGGSLVIVGVLLMVLPFVLKTAGWINTIHPLWGGLLVAAAIAFIMQQPMRPVQYPLRITLLSAFVIGIVHVGIFRIAAPAYDLQAASRVIATAQADGRSIASVRRYHSQFEFYGRLTRPVVQLEADQALAWAARHPDGYLVVIARGSPEKYPKAVFTQPYRSGYLAVWEGRVIVDNPAVLP